MAKIVIFGVQDFASLAHFYLKHDSPHEVVAFSTDRDFLPAEARFEGLPVIPFDEIEEAYPSSEFQFFAPMSHRRMNRVRADVYERIKAKGYSLISYISSKATTFPGTPIGDNCFILEDNTIQPFVTIGNNVVLWSGNHIGHHSVIGDHVLFTSHVVLSGHCVVDPFSFLGVNATIRDNVTIAEGTLVAMGATIAKNTEPWGVYKGGSAEKAKVLSKDLNF